MVLACILLDFFGHVARSGVDVLLTVLGNVVLVSLGGFVAGGTGDQLVDLGGIVVLIFAALDGVVRISVVGVVYWVLINA